MDDMERTPNASLWGLRGKIQWQNSKFNIIKNFKCIELSRNLW